MGNLQSFVDNGANFADTQAYKDITNSAKAGGQFGSGNRATALTDYYATNFRPERLNELLAIPKMGMYAATGLAEGIGGLQQNIGNANAAGTIGSANAWTSGLNALGSLNFKDLLSKYNIDRTDDYGGAGPGIAGYGTANQAYNPSGSINQSYNPYFNRSLFTGE